MNTKWLMVLMLGGLCTTGAFAQEKAPAEKKPAGEKTMSKIDTDGDGKISKDEADKAPKGKLKENFAAIDTNKDNYLDKEEIKAFRKQSKPERQPKQK